MKVTPSKINSFMFFKLPLAFFGGVRVVELQKEFSKVTIKHRWINQNPFKSMFWAAQGMAAEMSTGVLVIAAIKESGKNISMLVTHQEGNFFKKATGKITFICEDGLALQKAIEQTIQTKEGVQIHMVANGFNEDGIKVSEFKFCWSLKIKKL